MGLPGCHNHPSMHARGACTTPILYFLQKVCYRFTAQRIKILYRQSPQSTVHVCHSTLIQFEVLHTKIIECTSASIWYRPIRDRYPALTNHSHPSCVNNQLFSTFQVPQFESMLACREWSLFYIIDDTHLLWPVCIMSSKAVWVWNAVLSIQYIVPMVFYPVFIKIQRQWER